MKIVLANGAELNPLVIVGGGRYINGLKRDTLNFVFPEDVSLDEMDGIFTPSNCETITIYDDDGAQYIHTGYIVRAGLSRSSVMVAEAAETEDAIYEERVTVSMALATYTEQQLEANTAAVDALLGESGEE